ncbi:MAG TPA: FAD binding domain-containing protein, partial [Rubrobacteraceae bacterium]|nr:FAD binding domain-containing protein [Rubrobacteraceae bacterium]
MQVPAQFDYEVATSVEEAIELLQRHGPEARLLAGGHSLIPMMKLRLAFPEVLIDIHELDGDLRFVREDDGTL